MLVMILVQPSLSKRFWSTHDAAWQPAQLVRKVSFMRASCGVSAGSDASHSAPDSWRLTSAKAAIEKIREQSLNLE